ncbi:uncharacterized protein LOC118356426 [Zalophus californianus]|uniref:Uncharacterized protein LOC118356426 n=1 Tax=Zalophus californianus TaxID=9704 RepID=A0A6P9F4G7_ZALCA|nr:uncharacterized protein LOC118356426 [Zalophus californianus]
MAQICLLTSSIPGRYRQKPNPDDGLGNGDLHTPALTDPQSFRTDSKATAPTDRPSRAPACFHSPTDPTPPPPREPTDTLVLSSCCTNRTIHRPDSLVTPPRPPTSGISANTPAAPMPGLRDGGRRGLEAFLRSTAACTSGFSWSHYVRAHLATGPRGGHPAVIQVRKAKWPFWAEWPGFPGKQLEHLQVLASWDKIVPMREGSEGTKINTASLTRDLELELQNRAQNQQQSRY